LYAPLGDEFTKLVFSTISEGIVFIKASPDASVSQFLTDLSNYVQSIVITSKVITADEKRDKILLPVEEFLANPNFKGIAFPAHQIHVLFFMAEGISEEMNRKIAATAFEVFTQPDFYQASFSGFIYTLTDKFLEKALPLAEDSLIREGIAEGMIAALSVPDMAAKFKAAFGAYQWNNFRAISITVGSNADQVTRLSAALKLNADQAAVFGQTRVLIIKDGLDTFSDGEISNMRQWHEKMPEKLVYRLGIVTKQAPDGRACGYGGGVTGSVMNTIMICTNAYVYWHEIGHAVDLKGYSMNGTSTKPNLLVEDRTARRSLFTLAKEEGGLISGYAATNFRENAAEEFYGVMNNTEARLNTVLALAKSGKFASLRIETSLLGLMAHNTGDRSYFNFYSSGNIVKKVDVETDSGSRITKMKYDGKTIELEYDKNFLHLHRVKIDEVWYDNPKSGGAGSGGGGGEGGAPPAPLDPSGSPAAAASAHAKGNHDDCNHGLDIEAVLAQTQSGTERFRIENEAYGKNRAFAPLRRNILAFIADNNLSLNARGNISSKRSQGGRVTSKIRNEME